MATLGTEEIGRCKVKEVAVLGEVLTRVNVWIFCLPGQKKSGSCREVAISRGSTVVTMWSSLVNLIHGWWVLDLKIDITYVSKF